MILTTSFKHESDGTLTESFMEDFYDFLTESLNDELQLTHLMYESDMLEIRIKNGETDLQSLYENAQENAAKTMREKLSQLIKNILKFIKEFIAKIKKGLGFRTPFDGDADKLIASCPFKTWDKENKDGQITIYIPDFSIVDELVDKINFSAINNAIGNIINEAGRLNHTNDKNDVDKLVEKMDAIANEFNTTVNNWFDYAARKRGMSKEEAVSIMGSVSFENIINGPKVVVTNPKEAYRTIQKIGEDSISAAENYFKKLEKAVIDFDHHNDRLNKIATEPPIAIVSLLAGRSIIRMCTICKSIITDTTDCLKTIFPYNNSAKREIIYIAKREMGIKID